MREERDLNSFSWCLKSLIRGSLIIDDNNFDLNEDLKILWYNKNLEKGQDEEVSSHKVNKNWK